jgi:hypothetical protein
MPRLEMKIRSEPYNRDPLRHRWEGEQKPTTLGAERREENAPKIIML